MNYKKFLDGINLELNKQQRMQEDFAGEVSSYIAKRQKTREEEEAEEKRAQAEMARQSTPQSSPETAQPQATGKMTAPLVWFRDKRSYTMQQYLYVRNLVLYDLGRPREQQEAIPVFTAPQDKEQRETETRSRQTAAALKPLEAWFMEWLKAEAAKVEKARIDNYIKKEDGTLNEIGIKQLRQWFLNYVGNKYNARMAKNPKNEDMSLAKAITTFSQKYELAAPQPATQQLAAAGAAAPSPGTPDQVKKAALDGLSFGTGYEGNAPLKNSVVKTYWDEIQPYLNNFTDTQKAMNFGIQYGSFKKGVQGVIDPTLQFRQPKQESFLHKLYSQLA
jgi:hypothetical protein